MQHAGNDKRGGARTRMLKGGIIAFSARHATMPCVVRDMSDKGARLQVAQGSAIPDTFELIIELDGIEAHCQIAWRRPQEVGVSFLEEPRRAPPKRIQIIAQTGPLGRPSLRRLPGATPQSAALAGHPTSPSPRASSGHPPEMAVAQAAAPQPKPASPAGRPAPSTVTSSPVAATAVQRQQQVSVTPRPALPVVLKPKASAASSGVIPILIAEDDPDDRLLMQDAFAESAFTHPIAFVENGVELLKYVRGEAPYEGRAYPGIILLDLNMPKMDGRTALMHLKTDSAFKRIPVIVLTTSSAEDDIQRTYDLGVTAYVSKPGSHQGLMELVASLNDFWTRFVSLPA